MKSPLIMHMILIILLFSVLIMEGCSESQIPQDKTIYLCQSDSDCVPKPECHPLECINSKYAEQADKPRVCTAVFISEAAYSKEDCACEEGLCINKNNRPAAAAGSLEQESLELAKDFVVGSSTYKYDGSGIAHASTKSLDCASCWSFTFRFTSRLAGYGDRTGEFVAEIVTPHEAVVIVRDRRITGGIIDGKWDMIKDEMIPGAEHPEIPLDEYCEQDEDCACGIHKETKDCFYGNIEYVDESVQCPDFCTGFGGNLAVRCIDSRCQQIERE